MFSVLSVHGDALDLTVQGSPSLGPGPPPDMAPHCTGPLALRTWDLTLQVEYLSKLVHLRTSLCLHPYRTNI